MFPDRKTIESRLNAQSLVLLGVVSPDTQEDAAFYEQWLGTEKHAGMKYLENHRELRKSAGGVFPEAKSVIAVALPYNLGDDATTFENPRVAQYARFSDYHDLLKTRVERAASELFPTTPWRVTVDSAPVLERALAAKSEASFVGKNTCLIHKDRGSFLLLAEILVGAELAFDNENEIDLSRKTKSGGCGPCDLCQVSCPTGALNEDYSIDSRRCLAYWTIENRGTIPEEFWPHLSKYYYGCDICQLVCPYNVKAKESELPKDIPVRVFPDLYAVAVMDQKQYETYFGGTPMTRAKRNGLRRNALIALTVTKDPRLSDAMTVASRDAASPVGETLKQIEAYLTRH